MPVMIPRIVEKIYYKVFPQDRFLKSARGVIHVGANTGQERELYARYDLDVAWIEPIPSVFETLRQNLVHLPKQTAYQRLIASRDGDKHTLQIANNGGASSSIFNFAEHSEIWPDVKFADSLELEAITLPSFIREASINMNLFDTLVLDTQGAELLILKGSVDILPRMRFVKVEVPDFESYMGCAQLPELDAFLREYGFKEKSRKAFATSSKGGRYYDMLYCRKSGSNLP